MEAVRSSRVKSEKQAVKDYISLRVEIKMCSNFAQFKTIVRKFQKKGAMKIMFLLFGHLLQTKYRPGKLNVY